MLTRRARLKSRRIKRRPPLPATDEVEDPTHTPALRRIRSGILLVLLAAVLGTAFAALIGVATLAFVSLLDHAIG